MLSQLITKGEIMASKFMLCSFKTCPWVQRAAIMLRAKDVAYDITYIDRDNRPDWFLAVSPHTKVPVLQIGGRDARPIERDCVSSLSPIVIS